MFQIKKILIAFVFIIPLYINARDLSGKVIDELTGESIEYTNVFLLSAIDSSFVMGTITDEQGYFRLDNVAEDEHILKVSFVGYDTYFDKITTVDNLGEIHMKSSSKMLNEIVITAKEVPFKTGNNGSIITNVSTTLLNSVGTANDVIQRIPGVAVNDGNISVFGKGSPIVYINSRRLNNNEELEKLESSEISTIELITNPGARYDASGRVVLIIKTKTKQSGFSTQLTKRLTQGTYLGNNANIDLSYSTRKLNLFALYYYMYGKTKTDENQDIRIASDDIWQHSIASPYSLTNKTQQVSFGLDWVVDDLHTIGGQYQYNFQTSKNKSDMYGTSYKNNIFFDEFTSYSFIKEKPYRHLVNLFYKGTYNNHFSSQIDFNYLKNHGHRDQEIEETSSLENRLVNTFSQSDYELYAAELVNSYKSGTGLIDFGGEFNTINGSGFLLNKGGYTKNNVYTTAERKAAGFINYSNSIGDLKYSLGLRYEYTHEKATEDSLKVVNTNRVSHTLYPNLSLSKKFKEVQLSFNLSKRVRRPSFTHLSGNTVYVNRFILQTGNPYLKEVKIYDLNLQTSYKMIYLNIGYTYEKDPFTFYNQQKDNTESILLTMSNYPKYQEINATLNFSHTIAFWQSNSTIKGRKPFFSVDFLGKKEDNNKADLSFRTYNDLVLPNGFTLSINFSYQSNYSYYLTNMKHYERIDLGLRKSLFNNSLKLNIEVRDIFDWVKERNIMKVNNISFDQNKKRETRYGMLTITYLFNNYKNKYRKASAAKDEINRF